MDISARLSAQVDARRQIYDRSAKPCGSMMKDGPMTKIRKHDNEEACSHMVIVNAIIRARFLSGDPEAILGMKLALDTNAKVWLSQMCQLRGLQSAIEVLSMFVSPLLRPCCRKKPARLVSKE